MSLFNTDLPPGMQSAITAVEKQFILMRSAGSSIRDISQKLKKSTRTICDWNKKFAKDIISVRNNEFCDLQKKIIETKTLRLNFLKHQFNRVAQILNNHKIDIKDNFGGYEKFLNLYVKLADLLANCESEILSVGVKFKDNIEPEIYQSSALADTLLNEEFSHSENKKTQNENNVLKNSDKETSDNTEDNPGGKQNKTNYNTKMPKKFELYKKSPT